MLFKWLSKFGSSFLGYFKDGFKKFGKFLILKPNPEESLFQYVTRFFYFGDGYGSATFTYTLVAWFSIFILCTISVDVFVLSKLPIREFDPTTGKLIKESVRGIAQGTYALGITIATAIVFFIKFRDQRNAAKQITPPEPTEEDKKDPSIVDTLVNTIKDNVIK